MLVKNPPRKTRATKSIYSQELRASVAQRPKLNRKRKKNNKSATKLMFSGMIGMIVSSSLAGLCSTGLLDLESLSNILIPIAAISSTSMTAGICLLMISKSR